MAPAFIVKLPTMITHDLIQEGEHVNPTLAEITTAEDGPSLRNLRVLVVDDEPGAREVVSTTLARAQAEVRTAGGAGEALKVMDEWLQTYWWLTLECRGSMAMGYTSSTHA